MMVKEKNYLINEAAKEGTCGITCIKILEEELRLPINATSRGIVSIHRRT